MADERRPWDRIDRVTQESFISLMTEIELDKARRAKQKLLETPASDPVPQEDKSGG